MAELRVEPKKKTNYVAWFLLTLGVIALIIFLIRRFDNDDMADKSKEDTKSTEIQSTNEEVAATGTETITTVDGWGSVDRNSPSLDYAELKGSKKVKVRGSDQFAIYDLGEDVLFNKDDSAISGEANAQLKMIAASIEQRFKDGPIRLFGFTDAQGSAAFNKELAQQRAEAVKNWLVTKAGMKAERMSVEAIGESSPKASNNTAEGQRANRRVQIVVKKSNN